MHTVFWLINALYLTITLFNTIKNSPIDFNRGGLVFKWYNNYIIVSVMTIHH